MIVRDIASLPGTDREVATPDWTSRRLLLKGDGMGFSLHETIIRAGAELHMHYKNHVEAVYCVEGEGTLVDLDNDKEYPIRPGVMYALSGNEKHILKADSYLRTVCVFNPPVTGREVHGEDGAYAADPDAEPLRRAS